MSDKNIKVNSNSNVYSGGVKLTLKKGNTPYKVIKQHNSGTVAFFKYILNVVKGDVLPNERPAHVKLIYTNDSYTTTSKYGVLYDSVTSAKDTSVGDLTKATITYKFVIPETIVKVGTISGLQLESISGVKYATVDFVDSEGSATPVTITKNTNIELEWELNICNLT